MLSLTCPGENTPRPHYHPSLSAASTATDFTDPDIFLVREALYR